MIQHEGIAVLLVGSLWLASSAAIHLIHLWLLTTSGPCWGMLTTIITVAQQHPLTTSGPCWDMLTTIITVAQQHPLTTSGRTLLGHSNHNHHCSSAASTYHKWTLLGHANHCSSAASTYHKWTLLGHANHNHHQKACSKLRHAMAEICG